MDNSVSKADIIKMFQQILTEMDDLGDRLSTIKSKKSFPELHEIYHADPDVDIPGFGVHPRPFFSVASPKVFTPVEKAPDTYPEEPLDVFPVQDPDHLNDCSKFPSLTISSPALNLIAISGVEEVVFNNGAEFKQFDRGKTI